MPCFDILNIEYNEEGYLLDFGLPDTMRICVKEGDNWSHTEEAIRKQINNIEELYANDVKVVDFTAFYEGTDKPLRGNYEDYDTHGEYAFMQAETFEAREKKIGSITIKKNPNFPSGTHLQGYIKTNRAELRKVFGNPNMGESGDGKSKGKEWNLIVGGKRVTIYDYREKDKKGTKYFNIGGDGKYGALLVAQALSLHRNEKVHAIEISPAWDKEKFDYARGMKFPDSHDILTYERAKEYEDNRRGRYRAETFDVEFNDWANQEMMTHGKDISFKDWAEDEGMKHGNVPITEWAQHEEESHDARYGSEEEEIWEDEDYYNIEGEDYWDRIEGMYEDFCEDWEDNPDNDGQECPSMDEWVDTYGNFDAEGFRTIGGRGFQIEFKNGYKISIMFGDGNYGDHYNNPDFDYENSKEFLESSQAELAILKPDGHIMLDVFGWVSPDFVAALIPVVATGDEAEMIEVIQNREHREAEEWNWGGDPEGQLATALRKARIKLKKPRKPLKIEKLEAEWGEDWRHPDADNYKCSVCGSNELRYRQYANPAHNGFFCMNCGHSPCGINETNSEPCTCDMMEYGKYTWLGERPRTQFPSYIDAERFKKQEQDKENERIRAVGSKEKLDAIRKGAETSDYEKLEYIHSTLQDCDGDDVMIETSLGFVEDLREPHFNADTLGYSYDNPPDDEDPMLEWYEEYLEDEEWKNMGLTQPESFEDYSKRISKEYDEMSVPSLFDYDYAPQESREEYIERIEKEGMAKEEEEIKALMKEKGISYEEAQEMKYERDMEEYTHRHPWSAETFEGIPQSVSDLEAVEDVRCDKYELEVNFENEDMVIVSGEELKAIMDDGWDLDSVRSFEDAGMSLLFTRNPNRAFNAEMVWGHSMDFREHKPKAIPHIGGGAKYNGYFAIKGYEGDTKDGFRYRIFKDPSDKKGWYDANVYDVHGDILANRSHRLNPRFNDASITIGSFPTLEQAKRALVFRMIQDEQYYDRLTDGELDWLMRGTKIHNRKWKKAETSGQWEIGEQLEEAQMNAETFEGIPKSVSDLEAVEDVRCDKYEMEVNFENEDMVIVSGEELKAIMDDGWDLDSVRSFEGAGMSLLFTRNPNRAFRAEDKKRKKISGLLSDPFDELSLDSGGMKSVVVGIGIGLLACFGYNKWK